MLHMLPFANIRQRTLRESFDQSIELRTHESTRSHLAAIYHTCMSDWQYLASLLRLSTSNEPSSLHSQMHSREPSFALSNFLLIRGQMSHVACKIPSLFLTSRFINCLLIASSMISIDLSLASLIQELNVSAMLLSKRSHLLSVAKVWHDQPAESILSRYLWASVYILFILAIWKSKWLRVHALAHP